MKYTNEEIDNILETFNINLLPYQKELFKKMMNTDGPIYIPMTGKRASMCYFNHFPTIMTVCAFDQLTNREE